MFVVMFKAKGALNCDQQVFGPFAEYLDADDFLCTLPVALYCDWKYIHELDVPGSTVRTLEFLKAESDAFDAIQEA